jgi:excisionase family DNA binding protein
VPGNAPPETLCSPSVASELSGCPLDTVKRWVSEGKIRVKKTVGSQSFVCLEEVDRAWAQEQQKAIPAVKKPKRKAPKA